jgi:16S rRNA (uracil1498-N3)-methyltransferase
MFRVPDGAPRTGRLTLDGSEGHHASDVRRLRPGEAVWLTDGRGTRWDGVVAAARRGEIDVDITAVVDVAAEHPRLVVVQALAKGGRDEAAVEAMTEIGVDEVVAWSASRSVAKPTPRTLTKWQSTADAAARQSRRSRWPVVSGPVATDELVAKLATADLAIVLHEAADDGLAAIDVTAAGEVVVVVGPEGGITDAELSGMTGAGAKVACLGRTVLRSSTAGVAALAAICSRTRWVR